MKKQNQSWMEQYLSYTSEQESPELFHLWVGLSCISAVLGRNVWLDRGYYMLYPNMYVVLVSPSGRCRKTTACDIGVDILRTVNFNLSKEENKDGQTSVLMEKITPQALTQYLANQILVVDHKPEGQSKALIYASELSVFLGKEAAQTGMLALLTSLYGCPNVWEYHTKTQGKDYLFNVWLGILGATAPEWLVHGIPYDAIGGGLTARIIFVCQTETARKNPSPKVTNGMRKLKDQLIGGLENIGKINGQLSLSHGAEELYSTWYTDRDIPNDERLASFYEREHDHMLKVAILLAASSGELFRSNVISSSTIQEAIMTIEKVKEYMSFAYSGIGEHDAAKGYDRIVRQILENGGEMEHSVLLRKNWYHWDSEGFKRVIDLLLETNRIRLRVAKTGKKTYSIVSEKT